MRALLLASLLKNCVEENEPVVMPEGLPVQTLTADEFEQYRGILGGVNATNVGEVQRQLHDLGVREGFQVMRKGGVSSKKGRVIMSNSEDEGGPSYKK